MAFTTVSVDARPLRVTVNNTPRDPFVRTMLVWGVKPSCTVATSLMYTVAPLTVLIGRLLKSSMAATLLFKRTGYSALANFAVPAGRIRFWRFNAFETSIGESRFAYN